MSIIFSKDTYKLQVGRKLGITLLSLSALLILSIVVSNFYWLSNYDADHINERLINMGKKPTSKNMNAYVRLVVILSIVGNGLILMLFGGLILWGISKRRFGVAFGFFWLIIFITNGISIFFYAVQVDIFSSISSGINILLAIVMIYWLANLISYRQRLKQEMARRGRNG